NTFYCFVHTAEARAGHLTIVKGVYTGHGTAGQDDDQTGVTPFAPPSSSHQTYAEIMAPGRTMDVLEPEFDPAWATMAACCNQYQNMTMSNGKMLISADNQQDYPGWFFLYDPNQTAVMQQAEFGS